MVAGPHPEAVDAFRRERHHGRCVGRGSGTVLDPVAAIQLPLQVVGGHTAALAVVSLPGQREGLGVGDARQWRHRHRLEDRHTEHIVLPVLCEIKKSKEPFAFYILAFCTRRGCQSEVT